MDKDTKSPSNFNVLKNSSEKEMLSLLLPALRTAKANLDEVAPIYFEFEDQYKKLLAIVKGIKPSFDIDLFMKDGSTKLLDSEPSEKPERTPAAKKQTREKAIAKMAVESKTPRKSVKPTFDSKVMKMLESEELTPFEMSKRLDINPEDNRSRYGKLYSKSGEIGRRRERVALTSTYHYALRSWYERNGIKAAYPGDPDVWME